MFFVNTLESLTDLEFAIWATFLLVGPIITFVIGIIPSVIGGKILTIFLVKLLQSPSAQSSIGIIFGIVLGGLFGYILTQFIEWGMHVSHFIRGPSCALLSGTLAGAGAGAWYGWKKTILLRAR
jgi:hypothetical protein